MHLLATTTALCSDYRPIPAELVWVSCRDCPDNNWQLALFLSGGGIIRSVSLGALEYLDLVILDSDLSRFWLWWDAMRCGVATRLHVIFGIIIILCILVRYVICIKLYSQHPTKYCLNSNGPFYTKYSVPLDSIWCIHMLPVKQCSILYFRLAG